METVNSCKAVLDAGEPSVVGCDDSSVPTQQRSMDNCRLLVNELGKDGGEKPAENEDAPESGAKSRGKKVDNGEGDEVSDEEDGSGSDDSVNNVGMRNVLETDDDDDDDDDSDDDEDDDSEDEDDDDDDDNEDDDDDDDEDNSDSDEDMDSEDEDSGSEYDY